MTDPIADLLTRIRNAASINHKLVSLSYSKLKESLVKILVQQGYLADYQLVGKKPKQQLELTLKYSRRQPAIRQLKRISKPGVRLYTSVADLPKHTRGVGITILSTSKGIITARQAKKLGLGGELLCRVS